MRRPSPNNGTLRLPNDDDDEASFSHFGLIFLTRSQHFAFSARSLGHVMFWLAETAHHAGTGGRWEAVCIPIDWVFFLLFAVGVCVDGGHIHCECPTECLARPPR